LQLKRLFYVYFLSLLTLSTSGAEATGASNATSSSDLAIESIQRRVDDLEGAAELDEAGSKTLELYKQALMNLQSADEWDEKAKEYEELKRTAPELLLKIQERLAATPESLDVKTPPDSSLQQLEQLLAQAEAELKAALSALADLDAERTRRNQRKTEVPRAIAASRKTLEELATSPSTPSVDEPPQVNLALTAVHLAKKLTLENERGAWEAEIASYDARTELLTARRDDAARNANRAEQIAKAWREIVITKRGEEAEAAAREARLAMLESLQQHAAIRKLADENANLAERRSGKGLAGKIKQVNAQHERIAALRSEITSDLASLEKKIDTVGLIDAIGILLRRKRETLPDIRHHRRAVGVRQTLMATVQYERFELEEQRDEFGDIEPVIRNVVAAVAPSPTERDQVEGIVRELLQVRRALLVSFIGDYTGYVDELLESDVEETGLIADSQALAAFIDKHILWVRSASVPQRSHLVDSWNALQWLVAPAHWAEAGRAIQLSVGARPILVIVGGVFFVAWIGLRPRFRRWLEELGKAAARRSTYVFGPTVWAAAITLVLACLWPAAIRAGSLLLSRPFDASDFAKSAGAGLRAVSVALFAVAFVRQTCRRNGLAESHFGWSPRSLQVLRRHLWWLAIVALPCVFVVATFEWLRTESWQNSLGRFAFIVAQLALLFFLQRIFRSQAGIFQDLLTSRRHSWIGRLRPLWYSIALAAPLVPIVLSILGYYYSTMRISALIWASSWLALGLAFVDALALRWLLVSRRRFAIEQARRRAAELQAEQGDAARSPHGEGTDDEPIDLTSISAQTTTLLNSIVCAAFIVGVWLIWVDTLPALNILDQVGLWRTTVAATTVESGPDGSPVFDSEPRVVQISLGDVALALFVMLATLVVAKNVPGLLEIAILQRLPLQAGGRYAITTISRYLMTIVGIVVSFQIIGVGWSKVQWLAAAMTVGLGFGLQEIFANFVSGLILLFERPIRVGDTVSIGDVSGTVARIRIRATTVVGWDRKELVIPNKEFVTGQIVNWTLSDSVLRVDIPVGIAYGSDTGLAEKLLYETAAANLFALRDPPPRVIFTDFGASSLDFELRVYIASIDHFLQVRHEMHRDIDHEFRKNKIEIAFPQRDIHVRTIQAAIPKSENQAGE
jgi:potassium efflux system protein